MKTKDCATKNFVMVDGKPITVARDVYEAIRLENGRIRRLARREKRCAQNRYSKCQGDCQKGPWGAKGIFESLDSIQEVFAFTGKNDPESQFILKETSAAVCDCADKLVKDGSTILKMHYIQQYSCREIARRIGISHACVNKRLHIMLTHFHNHAQFFF